jgi:hypothetical protein
MNTSAAALKSLILVLFTFLFSCHQTGNSIISEIPDTSFPEKQYAQFTYDIGVKGVAPVEMTNTELTGGTLTVESDPDDPSNQCVSLNKTSVNPSDQLTTLKDFPAVVKGTVSVEVKLRVTGIVHVKQFSLFANSFTEIAGVLLGDGGKMTAIDNSGTNYTLIPVLQVNRWYLVKLLLDLSTKTYEVFVDGTKLTKSPLAWKNQGIAPAQFSRMMFRNCASSMADNFYVDGVTILVSDHPDLASNSGTDLSTSTSARLTGRTCPTLYYISLPIGWTPTKKWPIFMYNIREGNDNPPGDGPHTFAQKRGNMPFIIVSVKTKSIVGSDNGYTKNVLDYCNATTDQLFDEIAVIELFKQIKADYNGEDKFYWDGFSASGHAFWPLVMWRPEYIAAACCSACNYLGNGGPDPADLGRGMTSKGVSNAPERINLPVKQYTGEFDTVADIGVTTGKGMWQQFMNAKATCEAHGYKNVSLDILPGVGHTIHYDAELAYFYAHYLSTHPTK